MKREVRIGGCKIGGNNEVAVQGMVKSSWENIERVEAEVKRLYDIGAKIVRLAIPTKDAAYKIRKIKQKFPFIPLVADIHFNPKLGIIAIESGVDKIRINPGNISKDNIIPLLDTVKKNNIPIRIGINSGSLPEDKRNSPENIANYAIEWVNFLESYSIRDIVVSVKTPSVLQTIASYRILDKRIDYPLHIGLTAAGLPPFGVVKSTLCIGILLAEGIGDTIRVSLTDSSEEEVKIAYNILKNLGLYDTLPELIVCPTCSRSRKNIFSLAKEVESMLSHLRLKLKVAVMGCEVNGPGEAKDADLGIACSKSGGVIFKEGKIIEKVEGEEKELISKFKSYLLGCSL